MNNVTMLAVNRRLRPLVLLCCLSYVAPRPLAAQNPATLAQFHELLQDPHRLAQHQSFLFVGEISRMETVPRAQCKSGVENKVAYSVSQLLWIAPDSMVAPGYAVYKGVIDCRQRRLPSPPFTLKSKVIVYCEINRGVYDCLPPAPFDARNLKSVQSWIEDLRRSEGDPVLLQIHDRLKDPVERAREQPILFLGEVIWVQPPYTGPVLAKPRRQMRIKVSRLLLDESRGSIEVHDGEVHAWCNSDSCSGAVTGAPVIAYCPTPTRSYSTPILSCLVSTTVTEGTTLRLERWIAFRSPDHPILTTVDLR